MAQGCSGRLAGFLADGAGFVRRSALFSAASRGGSSLIATIWLVAVSCAPHLTYAGAAQQLDNAITPERRALHRLTIASPPLHRQAQTAITRHRSRFWRITDRPANSLPRNTLCCARSGAHSKLSPVFRHPDFVFLPARRALRPGMLAGAGTLPVGVAEAAVLAKLVLSRRFGRTMKVSV